MWENEVFGQLKGEPFTPPGWYFQTRNIINQLTSVE